MICSYMFFPWKGTLTDAGDGDGGRGAKNHKTNSTQILVLYFVPPKGTLTDAGDGDGGHLKNKKNHFKNNMF